MGDIRDETGNNRNEQEISEMNRDCSWKRTQEVQIDLPDLLRRLAGQWKRIAVCAAAAAVLAGAGSYVADKNGWISETDQTDDITGDGQEPAEPVVLTQEERLRGVAAARQLEMETQELKNYVEQSVLMQMDPYHKNTVQLLFQIEGASGWTTQKIVDSYLTYLINDGAAQAVLEMDSRNDKPDTQKAAGGIAGMDIRCLAELFQVSQRSGGSYTDDSGDTLSGVILSVDVTGRDAGMAAGLAEDMVKVLEEYSLTVQKECGRHTFTLVNSRTKERIDSDLLAWQRDKRTVLASDQANLKAMVDAFDAQQTEMYASAKETGTLVPQEAGTALKDGGAKTDSGIGEGDSARKGDSTIKGDSAIKGVSDSSDTGENTEELTGSVRVPYVLAGFLGGIAVYCVVYAGWYLLRDTVKSAAEFRSYYTFPFFGSIAPSGAGPASGQEMYERQKAGVLGRIRLFCRKQQLERFCMVTDFGMNEKERQCVESIADQLGQWGIYTELAEYAGTDVPAWDMLAETGAVLMVCRLGTTTHRMIDEAMEFYQENGILVLGAAALESGM